MKNKLKGFIKQNPMLLKYARLITDRKKIYSLRLKKNIKGKNNTLNISTSSILCNCQIEVRGEGNTIQIGDSCILNNVTFYINGNNNQIILSNNVRFARGGSFWIEDYNCSITIDDNSTFEEVHLAATEPESKISIGRDCMFAYGIDLRTGDSHSIYDSVSNKRINYAQNVKIGNHVWIASHVSVLKGAEIQENSIIATRAVVTKSFMEPNILIGGIPAKKMKENVNWSVERTYES